MRRQRSRPHPVESILSVPSVSPSLSVYLPLRFSIFPIRAYREMERDSIRPKSERGRGGVPAEFLAYRGANWLASDLRYCKPMRRRLPCPPPNLNLIVATPTSDAGQRHVATPVTLPPPRGGRTRLTRAFTFSAAAAAALDRIQGWDFFVPPMLFGQRAISNAEQLE
jgi:hypothetical protein